MTEFKISGRLRREKKKELSGLKHSLKYFWFYVDIDRVMGAGLDDASCNKMIVDLEIKINLLEEELSKPSVSVVREEKINQLGL